MFDENMSAFETPHTVQWCTALGRCCGAHGAQSERRIYLPNSQWEQIFYCPRMAASRQDSAGVLMNVLIDRKMDRDRVPPDIDAETEKSQIKRCPSCESVVSKGSRHSSGGRLDTPEIVSALEQLTDQLAQLAWNGNFKRLKVFSGTDPVPTESFESWRESTVVSVRYWTGPETTMKRKILESLCSLAVDVVKSYMIGHPDATSGDLIEVLEVTFGPVESATEMLHRFHSTFQKENEDLFVYLVTRPETARSPGAITDDEMDSLRIRQLKRGTLNNDPVAVTIRAYYQDKLLPGYVALMERVWQEETDAYVRVRRSPTSGHTEKSPADAKLLEENKKLRKQLEELKKLNCLKKPHPQLRLRKFLSVTSVESLATSSQTVQFLMKVKPNLHCVKYAQA
ncbi:hypothetical protein XELAEV_18016269mg [Xenopus laevis]|uniref:Paraneoplastic antigen Ma-like C-terminal domain-containing protein n=1 Tax=Xenopus laevis TaxID=8355 RepID=A0A974DJJ1_XENLA|nr:hypothetical protein XELAEV_18016269mg [Xenopus laevis]